jgi:hypothetical protein
LGRINYWWSAVASPPIISKVLLGYPYYQFIGGVGLGSCWRCSKCILNFLPF